MVKKSFFCAAAAMLLAGVVMSHNVEAADAVTANVEAGSGYAGDVIDVSFNLSGNPGVTFFELRLDYDSTVLEPVMAADGKSIKLTDNKLLGGDDILAPQFKDGVLGAFTGGDTLATSNVTTTGKLFTVSFKIKDDAAIGHYNVSFNGNFWSADFAEYSVAPTASVEVLCKHASTHVEDVTAAGCVTEGKQNIVCDSCGAVVDTKTIPAAGHKWNEGTVTKEATCTEAGEKTYTCDVCGETKTEAIPAAGHKWNEGTVTKEATCTEAGEKTYTCDVCGETKTEAIPATGHKGEWVVVKEATETESGLKKLVCTVCGETEEEIIPVITKETETSTEDTKETTGNNTENKETTVVSTESKENKENKETTVSTTEETTKKGETATTKKAAIPQTGDTAPVAVLSLVALMSAGMILVQKKRETR